MTRFVRNRIVLFVLFAWSLYWPIAWLTPRSIMLEAVNGWVAALSLGVLAAYLPGAWKALRTRPYRMRGAHLMILGISLIQIAIAFLFVWGWLFRVLDMPAWMVDNIIRGGMVHLLAIGSLLQMLAGDMADDDALPTRGWMHVGLIVAVTCGIVVAVMLTI